VHVKRRLPFNDHVHHTPPRLERSWRSLAKSLRETNLNSVLKATVPGSGEGSHAKLTHGLAATRGNAAFGEPTPAIKRHFHSPRGGAHDEGS
jgi:hypothetical protein